LHCLKKNYYLKKSGVKLSLEQKHEWDRTVRPIERVIGKILKIHPYQPHVAKIEGAQALLLKLKEKKAGNHLTAKEHDTQTQNKSGGKGENNSVHSASTLSSSHHHRLSTDGTHASMPSSPTSQSRPSTADQPAPSVQETIEEDEAKIVELDEMTPLEKEIRYMHCFEYACHSLSQLIINEAGITVSVFEDSDLKPSLTIARNSQRAVESATETLEKSSVASNLPPDQFHEKMLIAAAKKLGMKTVPSPPLISHQLPLGSWDAVNVAGNSFADMLVIKDRLWLSQVFILLIVFFCLCHSLSLSVSLCLSLCLSICDCFSDHLLCQLQYHLQI
jgi:hypothetical protein